MFKCCSKSSEEAKNLKKLHAFIRTLSDSNRLKILCILQDGPRCVCEIMAALKISDKLASHHLKKMKEAGLLHEKRDGNFIHYRLSRAAIQEYKKEFNQIIK